MEKIMEDIKPIEDTEVVDESTDGIKQLKYELVSVEDIGPNAKMINVKF